MSSQNDEFKIEDIAKRRKDITHFKSALNSERLLVQDKFNSMAFEYPIQL